MTRIHRFFATAGKHLEPLLADELRGLGAEVLKETHGGVGFSGPLVLAYRVCLWSRLANRVLLALGEFPADSPEGLYEAARSVPWGEHFGLDATFAVDCHLSHSRISHSQFAALKIKDAIVDQFRDRLGARPSVALDQPAVRINAYLYRDRLTLGLDLAGDSLHRRGYRQEGVAAPLKENLAAAVLVRAGWPELAVTAGVLVDPLCGSGTLPIEAGLVAADVAPGLRRSHWGLLGWQQHDGIAWRVLLEEAEQRRVRGLDAPFEIWGYDADPAAVRIARANAERAGLGGRVHFERRELADAAPPVGVGPGLVVANPPYGERLGVASELPLLYRRLGDTLRSQFPGWRAAVLTGNPDLGKRMGLRARRFHSLYNGPIECRLLHFEVQPEWFVNEGQGPRPLPEAERGAGAAMFANRLRKNLKQLRRWLQQEGIHCYRLYDADMPEYALAVDVYEGEARWLHVQEYAAPPSIDPKAARLRLREALGVLPEVLEVPPEQIFFKVRRRQRGSAQYERLAEHRRFHEVREDGCRFWVNFEDYLDTGLFLDHRQTRALVGERAQGKGFLNLFGYTGTATVYAARGGARSTTSLDLSRTYLDWAQRNLALNGLGGPQHEFIQADCLQWLGQMRGRRQFDLIFLDPPSFSTSKRMQGTLDVQRDHVALIEGAMGLLAPGGSLLFSCNLRQFALNRTALAAFDLRDLSRATLPKDFERHPRGHHCWEISCRTP